MEEDVTHIRKALEILRVPRPKQRKKHSWIKMNFTNPAGGRCIMGALEHVGAFGGIENFTDMDECADSRAIKAAAAELFPRPIYGTWNSVPSFNDQTGRTWEEVELVLEKAACRREEDGARCSWTLS